MYPQVLLKQTIGWPMLLNHEASYSGEDFVEHLHMAAHDFFSERAGA
jgi:hypothetical protein